MNVLACPACCATCDICSDTGGDGPCGLAQVAGTVTSDASFIYVTASNSIALSIQTSGSAVEVRCRVKFICGDSGDQARVFIKADSDGSPAYFAQLQVGPSAHLRLYSRNSGGTNTQLATTTLTAIEGSELILALCYGNGGLSAKEETTGTFLSTTLTTNITSQPYAGVGSGTLTTEIGFYDFEYYYGYNSSDKPTCRYCMPSCTIASDDFNRANSTNLGSDWTEVAGDFTITSNFLASTTTGSIVLHNARYEPTEGVRVTALALVNVVADVGAVRYIIDWSDSDNYYCAEYDMGADNAVRIIHRTGGSETILAEVAILGLSTVAANQGVAYDPVGGRIYALAVSGSESAAEYLSVSGIPPLANNICGLMLVGPGVSFDTFRMEQIVDPCLPPEDCDFCTDQNNPLAIADQIEVVIAGIVEEGVPDCGSCDSLNGTYVLDLIGSYRTGHATGCSWRYTFPSSICSVENLWAYRTASGNWGVTLARAPDPAFNPSINWSATGESDDCLSNSIVCAFDSNAGPEVCDSDSSTATITVPA